MLVKLAVALRQWKDDELKMRAAAVAEGHGEGGSAYDTVLHESEMDLRDIVESFLAGTQTFWERPFDEND